MPDKIIFRSKHLIHFSKIYFLLYNATIITITTTQHIWDTHGFCCLLKAWPTCKDVTYEA